MANNKNNNSKIPVVKIKKINDIVHQKSNQNNNQEKINKYSKQILIYKKLIESIKSELQNFNDETKEEDIIKLEENINFISEEIGNIEEIILPLNSQELNNEMGRLNRNYSRLETLYTSKLLKSISQKVTKQEQETKEEMKKITKKVTDDTNEITGNMLFSIATVFLGISLTSAIIESVKKMPAELMLFFFSATAWIALSVITISALILRSDDEKFNKIKDIYIMYSKIMALITILHIIWQFAHFA